MITTTLKRIRAHEPCADGWKKLLTHLGKSEPDDEPLPFSVIVESNGLHDALWCCRAEPQHSREWRLFAVWCARQVEHLMTDQRSRDALATAESHADGLATDEELAAAWDAACDAAWEAAWEEAAAAQAAAYAARDAAYAACAAWDAVAQAAWDAAYAACAACDAAQNRRFLEIVGAQMAVAAYAAFLKVTNGMATP